MDLKEDYIHFNIENNYILEPLEKKVTLTYDLLHPVFVVLNHFVEKDMKIEGEDKETIEDIFSIGFHYLYSCLDHIKRFLEESFNDDVDELLDYDLNLYLYLRTDELDTIFEEKNELLSTLLDHLNSTIVYRKKLTKSQVNQIEDELEKQSKKTEEITISDQFIDFADFLELDLL